MQPLVASGPATVSTVTSWSDIGRSDDLPELAPEATADLARVLGAIASVDTEGPRSDPLVRRWTEQFVTDVASLDDDLRVAAASALGADLFPYVVAVWADDMAGRLRSAWAQLAGSAPSSGRGAAEPEHGRVARGGRVPGRGQPSRSPRCGHHRGRAPPGARAEQLPPVPFPSQRAGDRSWRGRGDVRRDRQVRVERPRRAAEGRAACHRRGALDPHAWPAGLAADVRRCFSPDQAVELVFDVVRNAANRIAVALGADEAHVADGIEYFAVEADGALTYGLPVPGTSETV